MFEISNVTIEECLKRMDGHFTIQSDNRELIDFDDFDYIKMTSKEFFTFMAIGQVKFYMNIYDKNIDDDCFNGVEYCFGNKKVWVRMRFGVEQKMSISFWREKEGCSYLVDIKGITNGYRGGIIKSSQNGGFLI